MSPQECTGVGKHVLRFGGDDEELADEAALREQRRQVTELACQHPPDESTKTRYIHTSAKMRQSEDEADSSRPS